MQTVKEAFQAFESQKSQGYTTETALSAVFGVMRRSVPTIDLGVGVEDKVLARLIEKFRVEWNKLVNKINQGKYGPIKDGSFERFHKQANPDHHKLWLAWYKKKK